ncbi:MAG TPA: PDZ domain-containing protein, partial [Thermoanaerobaculia bacterium]|nr:PDZ domain-containing protein [Thermoanaerobaculia bacterium]
QVHVIPIGGGEPRQLTFYNDVGELPPRGGVDNLVLDWSPDGSEILFLPHRLPWSERMPVHYVVPFAGGMERPLGPPEGSGGMFSPDGTKLVYTPIEREFRTWKRYRGGRAQDVWTYDLAAGQARQITDDPATDNQPMWVGNTLYFTSDRAGGKLNLWAHDLGSGDTRQVTHHETWDVLWPAAGSERIVYEAGGWIWRFDPAAGESVRVPIRLYGDFAGALPRFAGVAKNIQGAGISPSGARAVFAARGELFTVPAEKGEVRHLTRTPGVRERDPAWSPDGRSVAYWSDASGEYELYLRPADGSGEPRRLTEDGASDPTWRYAPVWSPDGERIAFADRKARLRVLEVASGRVVDADRGAFADIQDATWSPDSRWLAYSKLGDNQLGSVWVWSRDGGRTHQLTSGDTHESAPEFDPQGRYLYFLSNRDFGLEFSDFEFDFVYTDATRVYVGVLAADGPALFLPESDEEEVAEGEEPPPGDRVADAERGKEKRGQEGGDEEPGAAAKKPVTVRIDPAGFERRVRAIPGSPGDYGPLGAVAKGPLYVRGQGGEGKLHLYDLEAREEKTVLEGVVGFELSASGEKMLFRKPGPPASAYGIVAAQPEQEGKTLDLAGMETLVEPRAEWAQEFVDAWRILRDWFYDPGMHGLDWQAMRAKYEPLVAHVAHRADLDHILGELGGELDSGHMYVQTSDDWQVERRDTGLLGAVVAADPSGYFRVEKIFPGENWQEDFRSPLTEPGVAVSEGDLILAVDGVSTRGVDNFYRLLANKADRVVTLRVAADASGRGAREERVRPIRRETHLRYLDWVQSRRRYVAEKSGGRIGYIHLPNTSVEGYRELFKGFYAQAHEPALILDARYNGGGFIPFHMIELLERPLLSYWARRDLRPFTTPGYYHRGPKATLINGYSGSGGDAFPYYFRQRGLGPLIGTRTWGGLIGISGNPPLMDGGAVLAPNFRFVDPAGMWAVEGVGVEPDIEVVDRPDLVVQGIDPSLDEAIEVLLAELERNPPAELTVPEPPRGR